MATTLKDVIAARPADERRKVETRARQLIAEEEDLRKGTDNTPLNFRLGPRLGAQKRD
jgi:hypothetical protein